MKERIIEGFDWRLIFVMSAITMMGVLSIYSITYAENSGGSMPLYVKQIFWALIGFSFFLLILFVDYHELGRFAYVYYFGLIVLLLLVLAIGKTVNGSRRWLSLGLFSFQPSEVARFVVVIVVARYLSDRKKGAGYNLKDLLVPSLMAIIPTILILKQPDLGTALGLIFPVTTMIIISGLRARRFGLVFLLSLMTFPFLWEVFWRSLKGYQRERIITYIDPGADPLGMGYQVLQSKIAIGSGGIFGKGLFGGKQSQLNFLPSGHTDFIFAVFAEEWGFAGVALLLVLYLIIIMIGIDIAYKARDGFGMMLASGILSMFAFYTIVNIGMTLGILPVVGVPLPLMSYGGTAMITTMVFLGLLLNIKMRTSVLFDY
ncbi:MAG: rod shape-determining protein RodA [Nitrospirae bacterium]|nr:rod shape-determining protein RodA [Nitrospirota bacterium]